MGFTVQPRTCRLHSPACGRGQGKGPASTWCSQRRREVTGNVADGEQAGNRLLGTVFEHLHVLVDVHAGHDGRYAHMAMDTVERRSVDGREPLSLLAEVLVAALRNQLVVALDGLLERGRVGDASFLASSSRVSALNVAICPRNAFFSPGSSGMYALMASWSNSLPGQLAAVSV